MQLQRGLLGQNTNEISLYEGAVAPPKIIATEVAKLKAAFPAMEMSFISVLSERIQAKAFTEERLKDAIASVIDNFKYKMPNIADILSFDKKIKLYTHNEAFIQVDKGLAEWSDFRFIEKDGNKLRIKITDL